MDTQNYWTVAGLISGALLGLIALKRTYDLGRIKQELKHFGINKEREIKGHSLQSTDELMIAFKENGVINE